MKKGIYSCGKEEEEHTCFRREGKEDRVWGYARDKKEKKKGKGKREERRESEVGRSRIIYLIISNSRREARASSSHGRTIRTFIGWSVRGPSGAALDKRFLLGLNRLPRNARLMQKRTQAACVWLRLYFLRLSPRHRGPLYFTSCLHSLPEFLELRTILRDPSSTASR